MRTTTNILLNVKVWFHRHLLHVEVKITINITLIIFIIGVVFVLSN